MKAKLGMRKVRPWKWMPFKNPARKDDLVLYHWRRATEKGQDYAFAKFNKKLEVWKPLTFTLHSDVKRLIFVRLSQHDFTYLISSLQLVSKSYTLVNTKSEIRNGRKIYEIHLCSLPTFSHSLQLSD